MREAALLALALACHAARYAPTPAPTVTPLVADDSTIRTAVAFWFSDRATAEATYGHRVAL